MVQLVTQACIHSADLSGTCVILHALRYAGYPDTANGQCEVPRWGVSTRTHRWCPSAFGGKGRGRGVKLQINSILSPLFPWYSPRQERNPSSFLLIVKCFTSTFCQFWESTETVGNINFITASSTSESQTMGNACIFKQRKYSSRVQPSLATLLFSNTPLKVGHSIKWHLFLDSDGFSIKKKNPPNE